ncbi:oxidoreductase [Aureimonas sp. OT7]|uniref:MDR family oxidoreductase n=1 Tax=Aureimonas sp. OT7 TaxID=2816454 RepID=UPI00177D8B04|nr:MDR family oxidoreductase [Aureimonas sp. OT7]QOG07758.1 oxidoreductase [Aureimonas sp. OT7]
MSDTGFEALVIDEAEGGQKAAFRTLTLADLPDHDVTVEVAYSTVNYKDGLAVTGKGRIARRLPMVAGIDLAGTVVESRDPHWQPGDRVLVNGWGLSETEWGGYTRFQRLKPEWLTRVPDGFGLDEAMAIGTAGYTAALCVNRLEDWGTLGREGLPVLVTGAAGGVGSVAVALLAARGHTVAASTGRPGTHDYLAALGASSFVSREELSAAGPPLRKERWSGAVDSVGSTTLVSVLAELRRDSAVAACGLAGGADLPGTVMPYILRGDALIGVNSVTETHARREAAWALLDESLDRDKLASMTQTVGLSEVPRIAEEILAGKVRGRVVVRLADGDVS